MSQVLCQNIEFQSGTLVYDLSPVFTQLWQKRLSLRESLFSCHRGRAAPDTLNDHSPWSNHQLGAFPAARSEGLFGERAYTRKALFGKRARAQKALFGKRARARKALFGKRARARTVKERPKDDLVSDIDSFYRYKWCVVGRDNIYMYKYFKPTMIFRFVLIGSSSISMNIPDFMPLSEVSIAVV